tara:strand:+ start:156 stop:413 length:258 start_codon:yes stop_codon:yes gene_type:complete
MGMLTGASLILCAVVFMGANKDDLKNIGRYKAFEGVSGYRLFLYDTTDGRLFQAPKSDTWVNEKNQIQGMVKWEIVVANINYQGK